MADRKFVGVDRWICSFCGFFLGKSGLPAGTGGGRVGWCSAVVPAPQGSRLGRLVDHHQHPGLDNRFDADARVLELGRLTRRIDRANVDHFVQVFVQNMILRDFRSYY